MKKLVTSFIACVLSVALFAGSNVAVVVSPQKKPKPSPTATPTPIPSPTVTPSPSVTPTPTPSSSVVITSPTNGATLSGNVVVTGNAQDVLETYLIVDDSVRGFDASAPYSYNLDTTTLADGQHFMYIRAWNASGSIDSPRVIFNVANSSPTPTATPTPIPTPTPSPTPTPLPSPTASSTKSIFTANLSHGRGTDGRFDYERQANVLSADIVATQEVSQGDLPNWDIAFSNKGMSRVIYLENYPQANEGQAIWSSLPFTAVYTKQLSSGFISWDGSTNVDRSAIAVAFNINGSTVLVVDTHLCWSRCADTQADTSTGNSWQRTAQAQTLLNWVDSLGYQKVILTGDFNFAPYFPQYPLFSSYTDAWLSGVNSNKAFADWGDRDNNGVLDMPVSNTTRTADIRRIDYFFLLNIQIDSIVLPDLRAQCSQQLVNGACPEVILRWNIPEDAGVRPSDHNFKKLVFTF